MPPTRRRILATVALAQSSLLGGCFGDSGGTTADTEPTDSSAPSATPEPTAAEPTATETATATATPVAHADLAAATGNVLAEFEWFRTEYDDAILGLKRAVSGVFGVVEDLETAEQLTESDVTALREATTHVAEYVQANLVDHFAVPPALRIGDNVYVRDLERGVTRGDERLQNAAISRAGSFYQRVVSGPYVDNEFSRRPVYGPLYDMLVPGGSGNHIVALASAEDDFVTWAHPDRTESTATDGVARHTHEFPSGHRTYTHAHDHSTPHPLNEHSNEPQYNELYAYGDDGVALLEDTASWRERLDDYRPVLTDLFGPVRSEGREYGVTMMVGTIDAGFTAEPLYVERFASPQAARTAVSGDGPVSASGTTSFAGRRWDRVFYDVDDVTVYAYRFRAGASVITALPADVPWERRPEWTAGLASTWLASPPSGG
ncbi:hypothetical protein [Haloplanus halophilus]|uniref:hypothetical protein n=1 Tax=Haloplanus halophilus TaxID=2949993 RepID=UPI00203D9A64|nr:hypothetical protein [Haloplanus sp. GDY1]